ncbi:hypothetical protein [Flavivirga jejuensis]|uniref:Uncharacterized protein n=1 Tax=Flavivirga jejuensis TaxID=870487 RepID=A0ABT8WUR3_9FLAO|nr:hypothetical protein [Flavivirga jejuensis]MDO5976923.1 hypothetical protein [Flavivirga jejuensis]
MDQSKFSLADLFTVLGALIFGYICFLSINLFSYGNLTFSIMLAFGFFLVLGGLAFWAKWTKRTNYPSKFKRITEWVLLFVFVITAVISLRAYSHYFELYNNKEVITSQVITNIEQVENMFVEYEDYSNNRLMLYERRLNSVVRNKQVNPREYVTYGFEEGTDDSIQIENKMFTLNTQVYPSNYKEMKQIDSIWLASSKNKVEEWKSIGIVTVLKTLEVSLRNSKTALVEFSTFRAPGEKTDNFAFPMVFNDVSDQIQTLQTPSTVLSFGSAIVLYLLMLFSYFVTKRSTKDPGLKFLLAGSKSEKHL